MEILEHLIVCLLLNWSSLIVQEIFWFIILKFGKQVAQEAKVKRVRLGNYVFQTVIFVVKWKTKLGGSTVEVRKNSDKGVEELKQSFSLGLDLEGELV